jgi:hypothetical protein
MWNFGSSRAKWGRGTCKEAAGKNRGGRVPLVNALWYGGGKIGGVLVPVRGTRTGGRSTGCVWAQLNLRVTANRTLGFWYSVTRTAARGAPRALKYDEIIFLIKKLFFIKNSKNTVFLAQGALSL